MSEWFNQIPNVLSKTAPSDEDDAVTLREKLDRLRLCAVGLWDGIQALDRQLESARERLDHALEQQARAEHDSYLALENPREPDEDRQGRRLLLAENKRIRFMALRYLEGLPHERNAPTAGLVHQLCKALAKLREPAQERETKLLDIVACSLGSWPAMDAADAVSDLAEALGVTIQYSPDGDHARIDPATLPSWYVNAYEQEGIDWG